MCFAVAEYMATMLTPRYFFLFLIALGLACRAGAESHMPLDEVQPGMTGYWETVVSGTTVERFQFEVVGIVPHFIGPGRSAILARATEESQIVSGPVAGMSGSPCYIDGRLVGAYAYGYTWPKQQTLIGITPIADMMEAFDKERLRRDAESTGKGARASSVGGGRSSWLARAGALGDWEQAQALLAAGRTGPEGTFHATREILPGVQPLPTPFFTSGLSAGAWEPFTAAFEALGMVPMAGAGAGQAAGLTEADIGPGTALAGVLMDGDFRFAAVGTVTWREGDEVLAFGHPFMSMGDVSIPMAPAEVVVVVQSLARSFKLANVGPITGSLRQDRLSAVTGDIGKAAPLTPVSYRVLGADGVKRDYGGRLLQDRYFSPLLASVALLQTMRQTMETADDLTYRYRAVLEIEGGEVLEIRRTATGDRGPVALAMDQWLMLSLVTDNPFEEGRFESLEIDVEVSQGWELSSLGGLRVMSGEARSGEDFEVALLLNHYHGGMSRETVRVPIPRGLKGQELTLFVGDAAAANRLSGQASLYTVNSFEGLLNVLRGQRANDGIYLKLLRPMHGLRIEGESLPGLPPSVSLLMDNARNRQPVEQDTWLVLWETRLDAGGVFEGSHRMPVPVN